MEYELSRIAAICGGKFRGCDTVVRSVVTDSRSLTCELGCSPMFVALRGANHDSHEFLREMYDRGVRAFCGRTRGRAAPPAAAMRWSAMIIWDMG